MDVIACNEQLVAAEIKRNEVARKFRSGADVVVLDNDTPHLVAFDLCPSPVRRPGQTGESVQSHAEMTGLEHISGNSHIRGTVQVHGMAAAKHRAVLHHQPVALQGDAGVMIASTGRGKAGLAITDGRPTAFAERLHPSTLIKVLAAHRVMEWKLFETATADRHVRVLPDRPPCGGEDAGGSGPPRHPGAWYGPA